MWQRRRIANPETVIVFFLVLGSCSIGAWYYAKYNTEHMRMFTRRMEPAVMFALGKGFVCPGKIPAVEGFVYDGKPDHVEYDDIPEDFSGKPLTLEHRINLYLLWSIALCWRLFGVSWEGLAPLIGMFCGLFIFLVYCLFRFFSRKSVAAAGALLVLFAPAHMAVLSMPRDYAKGPFILAALLILGVLLMRPAGLRKLAGLSAVLGLVIGVGYGFRQDIYVMVFIAPVLLLFFLPGAFREQWLARLAAVAVMTAVFLVTAWPILQARGAEGNTTMHHVLGGVFRYNEEMMGVGGAPYILHNEEMMADPWIYVYNETFYHLGLGKDDPLPYLSTAYDVAGRAYMRAILAEFPADMLTRGYASLWRILQDAPWLVNGPSRTGYDVRNAFVERLARFYGKAAGIWHYMAPWAALVVFLGIALKNMRIAVAMGLLTLYLGMYPSIQFQARHVFHLVILPIGLALIVMEGMLRGIKSWRGGGGVSEGMKADQSFRSRAYHIVIVGLLGAFLLLVPLWGLRFYQTLRITRQFEQCASSLITPVPGVTEEAYSSGQRILHLDTPLPEKPEAPPQSRWYCVTEYLVLDFTGQGALPETITMNTEHGFDSTIHVRSFTGERSEGPARIFFPVYRKYQGQGALNELVLKGGDPHLPVRLCRVAHPEAFPFQMTLVLGPEWRTQRKYKILEPVDVMTWQVKN